MSKKIYAVDLGGIYRVAMDPVTSTPLPLSSHDDEPIGAFPFMFTEKKALEAQFPGAEIVYLKPPKQKENTVAPLNEVQQAKISKMLGEAPKKSVVIPIAAETGEVLEEPVGLRGKALEFLKRLETALQYASKKNAAVLQIKIEVIRELINEVFQTNKK